MTRDEIAQAMQDTAGNSWGNEAHFQRFAALVAADERKRFYGQDKPAECVNGCPANKVCDYCQIVEPVKALIAAEREACAKLCEEHWRHSGNAMNCADAIRARGQDPMPLFDDWPGGWRK